jgi:phosphopantothenoylcysteine synthetase/decarboxylase
VPSFGSETGNVLYLIVCGAPPAANTAELVEEKQAEGWDVCVVATPAGKTWLDLEQIERVTGHEVRTALRQPSDRQFEPLGDAVLVAPATFNTINKLALGISDNLALGLVNEAIGAGVDLEVRPVVNAALGGHPAFRRSLDTLSEWGVAIVSQQAPRTS